jgi:SAM-dependent methyltransferase
MGERYYLDPSRYGVHAATIRHTPAGSRVLDVGCAKGYLAQELTRKGCVVYGIDLDEQSVRAAREHCAEAVAADLDALPVLPWPGIQFDVILCLDVLEHLKDPSRLLHVLRQHLSPAGLLLASIPNIANYGSRLRLLFGRFDYQDSGLLDRTHLRFFTLRTARALLTEAGYEVIGMDVSPGLWTTRPYVRFVKPILRTLRVDRRVEYWLARAFPTWFALQFLFRARPSTDHGNTGGPELPQP